MNRSIKRPLLIATTAFFLGLLITIAVRREPMQSLTRDAVRGARARWNDVGPERYDIRYELNGSVYEVRVRSGIVDEVMVDGVRPVSTDWGNYSVDGLFDLLELEVENLTDPSGPFGGRGASILTKVRFDDDYGYPVRYLRSGGGARSAVVIVQEFTPLFQ